MAKEVIAHQGDWERIRCQFPTKSSYRDFSGRYEFHPNSTFIGTGVPIEEVVRAGKRRDVFATCLRDGMTVEEANRRAKERPGRAEHDADIFLGLFTGYIALLPPA